MVQLIFRQLIIEVSNEPAYTCGSADNPMRYEREYRLDDGEYAPSSRHAVRVLSNDGDSELANCILAASHGATGVHDHTALVHDDSLILAVGPFMVSLNLPTLDLHWKTQTDDVTCFGVYHSEKHRCYISHGELDVARVSYAGAIEWSHSGADIFTNGFVVTDDNVEAIDWNNVAYAWDIGTGRIVRVTPSKTLNPIGNKPTS